MTERYITSPEGERFALDERPRLHRYDRHELMAWERKQQGSIRAATPDGRIIDYRRVEDPSAVRKTSLTAALTVFSAANPDGYLLTNRENFDRTHHLYDELTRLGLSPRFVTLFEHAENWTFDWYEPAVAVTGVSRVERAVIARAYGQVGCLQVGSVTLRYEAAFRAGLSQDVHCAESVVEERTCPMKHRQVDDEGKCLNIGGPWNGAAQRAATLWSWTRTWALGLYGCDRCSLNKVPTPVLTNGTAPTAAVTARRRLLGELYEIVVADGAYGHTNHATVGVFRTGETIFVTTRLKPEPRPEK